MFFDVRQGWVCSHLSGLWLRLYITAGPDGIRGSTPYHRIELLALTVSRVWPIPVTLFRHHIIITLAIKFFPPSVYAVSRASTLNVSPRLSIAHTTRAVPRNEPEDRLVGHRHHNDIGRPARQQGFEPWRTRFLFAPRPQQIGSRPVNQELSQIAVSALRYSPEPYLAAAGVLPGNQSKPGRQLTPGAELRGIADGRDKGRGRDQPDTRNRLKPPARLVGAVPGH